MRCCGADFYRSAGDGVPSGDTVSARSDISASLSDRDEFVESLTHRSANPSASANCATRGSESPDAAVLRLVTVGLKRIFDIDVEYLLPCTDG